MRVDSERPLRRGTFGHVGTVAGVPRASSRPVGCHVFISGGLRRALIRARDRGAETLQIFPSNPRGWAVPDPDRAEEEEFRRRLAELSMPLFLHAPYLVNIAARDPVVDKST